MTNVKNQSKRIPNVATRDRRVLFKYRAAGRNEPALFRLNVRHKKIKDRPVFLTLFNVQTKRARFKAHERCAPLGDGQTENGTVEFSCLGPGTGSDNDIA